MKTLFEEWQSFERAVVPAEASPTQREEMRRSFYAGAAASFHLVMDEAITPDDEDVCDANLKALGDEIRAFPSDLRAADGRP